MKWLPAPLVQRYSPYPSHPIGPKVQPLPISPHWSKGAAPTHLTPLVQRCSPYPSHPIGPKVQPLPISPHWSKGTAPTHLTPLVQRCSPYPSHLHGCDRRHGTLASLCPVWSPEGPHTLPCLHGNTGPHAQQVARVSSTHQYHLV